MKRGDGGDEKRGALSRLITPDPLFQADLGDHVEAADVKMLTLVCQFCMQKLARTGVPRLDRASAQAGALPHVRVEKRQLLPTAMPPEAQVNFVYDVVADFPLTSLVLKASMDDLERIAVVSDITIRGTATRTEVGFVVYSLLDRLRQAEAAAANDVKYLIVQGRDESDLERAAHAAVAVPGILPDVIGRLFKRARYQ